MNKFTHLWRALIWCTVLCTILLWYVTGESKPSLLASHRPLPTVKIGALPGDLGQETAIIVQHTLHHFGYTATIDPIPEQDYWCGISSGTIDLVVTPMSSPCVHVPDTQLQRDDEAFQQFYTTFVSYLPAHTRVGDPTEHAQVQLNNIYVPLYTARVDSQTLRRALSFISGEFSVQQLKELQSSHPDSSLIQIAQLWWDEHYNSLTG